MRKTPTLIAFGFITITLWRVGQFSGARMAGGWSGWVFSVILGVAVFVSAYYTRESITRGDGKEDRRDAEVRAGAWMLLILCVAADGLFNLAEVWYAVNPALTDLLLVIATVVFGLFPTLAAAGMGALQGRVDRLPRPPVSEKTAIAGAFKRLLVRKLDLASQERPQVSAIAPQVERKPTQEPQARPALQGKRAQVLELATRKTPASQAQIAQEVNLSRQRVGQIMQDLKTSGYLHVNGSGKHG